VRNISAYNTSRMIGSAEGRLYVDESRTISATAVLLDCNSSERFSTSTEIDWSLVPTFDRNLTIALVSNTSFASDVSNRTTGGPSSPAPNSFSFTAGVHYVGGAFGFDIANREIRSAFVTQDDELWYAYRFYCRGRVNQGSKRW